MLREKKRKRNVCLVVAVSDQEQCCHNVIVPAYLVDDDFHVEPNFTTHVHLQSVSLQVLLCELAFFEACVAGYLAMLLKRHVELPPTSLRIFVGMKFEVAITSPCRSETAVVVESWWCR